MSAICVDGLVIAINTANSISRNEGKNKMSTEEHALNDSDIKVAKELGTLRDVAKLKFTNGKKGMAGVALFADDRPRSPFGPPAAKIPGNSGLNPGKLDDELVTTVIEPTDSDIANPRRVLFDPADDAPDPMNPHFPDGSTSISKRAKAKK